MDSRLSCSTLAYRFILEHSSLSRTSNSIFHADSNENPKFEASTKCQVSGIGRRDRIPRVSRFDGSDRMAFLAIFLNISFLSLECHFETSFTSIFVGLYHGMRYGGIILWVVLHNFIEEFVTNYLRGICLEIVSWAIPRSFTIECITVELGLHILRKKFLSGDKIFFSPYLSGDKIMIKYSNSQYGEKDNGYKQEHMNIVMKNYNKTCLKYKQGNIFLFQIVIVSFILKWK